MKNNFVAMAFIFGSLSVSGCEKYKNYNECHTRELQKFSYEPNFNDRFDVDLLCESKFPYERKIFDVKFEWYGDRIRVLESSHYDVTKVKLTVLEDCDDKNSAEKQLEFYFENSSVGFTNEWKHTYTCHKTDRAEFWGIMNRAKLK